MTLCVCVGKVIKASCLRIRFLMIIQYASDLHLEFEQNFRYVQTGGIRPAGEYLVLAGDIVNLQRLSRFDAFWDWCSDNFEETIFVPGNHDWYGEWEDLAQLSDSLNLKIRSNVRCCSNAAIRIGSVDFICSTLWSDLPPQSAAAVSSVLLDFRKIFFRGARIRIQDYVALHKTSLSFLKQAVNKSTAEHIIVVTHHVPSMAVVSDDHKMSPINSGFATELGNWIADTRITYWIYGHSHVSLEVCVGQTRIVSNQLGYIGLGEGKDYCKTKLLEL